MKDLVSQNGFKVIAAGAFVAQHSIFPKVAKDRPDLGDTKDRESFTKDVLAKIRNIGINDIETLPEIHVKANNPYRTVRNIPLTPTGNKKCIKCGTCVKLCPIGAIPQDNPRKTDSDKCISCARCIAVCPEDARVFSGLVYKIASFKFTREHMSRQPNVIYL